MLSWAVLIDSTVLAPSHTPPLTSSLLTIGRFSLIIMDFLGKVIPVRLLKRSNRDHNPKYSIAVALSTIPTFMPASMARDLVTVNKQSDLPGHLLTLTLQDDSVMHGANNVVRQGLNLLSPIAGGIPVAGTPLKASIDALLVVLTGINVSHRILENILHV